MNFVSSYSTHRGGIEAQTARYLQNERLSRLNWEYPGQVEFDTGSIILKHMKELLQQDSFDGGETSPKQMLLEVFSYLWTYFLFNGREGAQIATRRYDLEQGEFILSNGRVKNDCEVVAHILQLQTRLLNQNSTYEESTILTEHLGRILYYLEQTTQRNRRDVQATRSYDEKKEFEELDWKLR